VHVPMIAFIYSLALVCICALVVLLIWARTRR
jgi:hypothetical protein